MLKKFYQLGTIILVLRSTLPESIQIPHKNNKSNFCKFLQKLQLQGNYESFVILSEDGANHPKVELEHELKGCDNGIPRFWLHLNANPILKSKFNSKMLLIIYFKEHSVTTIERLSQFLRRLKGMHILLRLQIEEATLTRLEQKVKNLFTQFFSKHIPNVIIILNDFQKTKIYYSYQPFPSITLEAHKFDATSEIFFPQRMQNLFGYPVRTYPDQLQPRTLLYRNQKGQIKMLGYIGRLIETFTEKLNATLTFALPIQLGRALFFTDILQLTRNGTLDIPASIACLNEHASDEDPLNFSHYIEIGEWFPMLPVADTLTLMQIYVRIFSSNLTIIFLLFYVIFSTLLTVNRYLWKQFPGRSLWLGILFNEHSLLGTLGGTSSTSVYMSTFSGKFIVILICTAGLVINTMFNIYLQTFTMYHPLQEEINSFTAIKQHNLKILILPQGYQLLSLYTDPEFLQKYGTLFEIATNISRFVEHRKSYNKSMAIAMTSGIWSVMSHQQHYFTRAAFRYSEKVMFSRFMFYALPMPEYSIFEQPLNSYILQLHASGIFEYWYRCSFFDMVALKLLSFEDLSIAVGLQPAVVMDFYWIWLCYGIGVGGSIFVFLMEILYVYKGL